MPEAKPAEPEGRRRSRSPSSTRTAISIVLDKPAGLVVHPAGGQRDRHAGQCADRPLRRQPLGHRRRPAPGIVHRLDKDTSPACWWSPRPTGRIRGSPRSSPITAAPGRWSGPISPSPGARRAAARGTIDAPASSAPAATARRWRPAALGRGATAITHVTLVERYAACIRAGRAESPSLMECRLETGRTHQIRVHMAHIGHPLLGDERLRPRLRDQGRACLPPTRRRRWRCSGARRCTPPARLRAPRHAASSCVFESPLPPELAAQGGPRERRLARLCS